MGNAFLYCPDTFSKISNCVSNHKLRDAAGIDNEFEKVQDGAFYKAIRELETQTMICGDLGHVRKEKLDQLKKEIGDLERMLKAMIKSL